jgi:hypothetical protein
MGNSPIQPYKTYDLTSEPIKSSFEDLQLTEQEKKLVDKWHIKLCKLGLTLELVCVIFKVKRNGAFKRPGWFVENYDAFFYLEGEDMMYVTCWNYDTYVSERELEYYPYINSPYVGNVTNEFVYGASFVTAVWGKKIIYYTKKYYPLGQLRNYVKGNPLSISQTIDVGRQLLEAMIALRNVRHNGIFMKRIYIKSIGNTIDIILDPLEERPSDCCNMHNYEVTVSDENIIHTKCLGIVLLELLTNKVGAFTDQMDSQAFIDALNVSASFSFDNLESGRMSGEN